jgi:hypothetical protein
MDGDVVRCSNPKTDRASGAGMSGRWEARAGHTSRWTLLGGWNVSEVGVAGGDQVTVLRRGIVG